MTLLTGVLPGQLVLKIAVDPSTVLGSAGADAELSAQGVVNPVLHNHYMTS